MKCRYAVHIVVCAGAALGLAAVWQTTALAQSKAASGSEVALATGTERAGWHIVNGLPNCAQQFLNVATTGPDAAWVLGAGLASTGGCAADGIDVNYWNGASWSLLPATSPLPGQTGFSGAIAASSTKDVWVFPVLSGPGSGTQATAENWNGSAWTTAPLGVDMQVIRAFAVSTSDAWAFGRTQQGSFVVVRYDGSSWQRVSFPGGPAGVSALSANDMWAVGPSAKTASRPVTRQVVVAMHWNGKAWQTLATPRIKLPKGEGEDVVGVAATGPRNLWWVEQPVTSKYQKKPGTRLLHWNGKRWSSIRVPSGTLAMTQDGHGGVWLEVVQGPSTAPVTVAYHYSATLRSTKRVLPIPAGYNSTNLALFWIPRSQSVWAVGFAHASNDSEIGLVERYNP